MSIATGQAGMRTLGLLDLYPEVEMADDRWWADQVREMYEVDSLIDRAARACVMQEQINEMQKYVQPLRDVALLECRRTRGSMSEVSRLSGLSLSRISTLARRAAKDERKARSELASARTRLRHVGQ